ncbi:MAG: hypothetical protein HYY76_12515 [Acidobacteria bacterium]|nr:hypothetical protein [Acidobacteriota bacterium]
MVARTERGDCVFYHRGSGLCVVQRDEGEASMPATCRHFPRLALRDCRGTFITLTHYCPTAAALLFRDDVPIAIVEGPAAFPTADYDGLEVTADEWPPLLHRRMLMDLDAYSAWERHMVARCADERLSPESVVATLDRDARLLRQYRPGKGPLAEAVVRLPADCVAAPPPSSLATSLERYGEAIGAVPDDLRPPPDDAGLPEAYIDRVLPEWGRWNQARASPLISGTREGEDASPWLVGQYLLGALRALGCACERAQPGRWKSSPGHTLSGL